MGFRAIPPPCKAIFFPPLSTSWYAGLATCYLLLVRCNRYASCMLYPGCCHLLPGTKVVQILAALPHKGSADCTVYGSQVGCPHQFCA